MNATYAEWLWLDHKSGGGCFEQFWEMVWRPVYGLPAISRPRRPFSAAASMREAQWPSTLCALKSAYEADFQTLREYVSRPCRRQGDN